MKIVGIVYERYYATFPFTNNVTIEEVGENGVVAITPGFVGNNGFMIEYEDGKILEVFDVKSVIWEK